MRCSEWARRHFHLSPESSSVEGPFDPWPWQVAILDCMGNDSIRSVTWRKSARIGYTKCLTAATGYFHHHKRRNVLIYQPTDDDAKRFCKQTIDPMLRDVAVLSDLLSTDARHTLQAKSFLGSVLNIEGGKSANNYRSFTKDVLIFDELDAFEADIEGEGDPVSLGQKRIRDSSFPKDITGTTPTIDGQSLIQKRENEADLVFRFKVRCIHCGERQHYEWGGPDVPHGFKWHDGDADSTCYVCRECAGLWFYSDAWQLMEGGRWETECGHWIDAESNLRGPDGELEDWPRHIAFVCWAAMSLLFPWPEMVYEFLDAKGDVEKLKTFTNTTLGEYWREEVVSVEPDPLYNRREPYTLAPEAVRLVTVGVDVQVDRLEYELVGWGPEEESWGLGYRVIPGEPTKADVWNVLLAEVREHIETADGRRLKPRVMCVDSGYLAEEVYAFCRRAGIRFAIPVKGSSLMGQPIQNMPRKPSREKRVYITPVGTDNAKETIYRRLMLERPGPGYCHFPESDEYSEEYFAQLTGEEKRPVRRQGRKVLAFQQAYSSVEALDCRVYALAAAKIAQDVYRVRLGATVAKLPTPGGPPDDDPPPGAPAKRQDQPTTKAPRPAAKWVQRPRRRGGWMKRR